MEIRARNWEDPEYDQCGNTAKAVLEFSGIKIALCEECINELNTSINKFNNTLFCYKCMSFIPNPNGFHYSGSCRSWALQCGDIVREQDVGYRYCVDPMDTCDVRRAQSYWGNADEHM